MVQTLRPSVLVIEEVLRFERNGLAFIGKHLGDLYSFDWTCLDPKRLGYPVSRPRLYCVGTSRSVVVLDAPLDGVHAEASSSCADASGLDY